MTSNFSAEQLSKIVKYDPESGDLSWLPREPHLFSDGPRISAQGRCNMWNGKNAGASACRKRKDGYFNVGVMGRIFLAHRVAWCIYHGNWPTADIDHINGDRSDNRISNLRDVSHSKNCWNKPIQSNNTSGHPGVSFDHGRWRAICFVNRKVKSLGWFDTKDEAIACRKRYESGLGLAPRRP